MGREQSLEDFSEDEIVTVEYDFTLKARAQIRVPRRKFNPSMYFNAVLKGLEALTRSLNGHMVTLEGGIGEGAKDIEILTEGGIGPRIDSWHVVQE